LAAGGSIGHSPGAKYRKYSGLRAIPKTSTSYCAIIAIWPSIFTVCAPIRPPMIKSIKITVIPHEFQRYSTTGDWQITDDVLHIDVSDMGDWRMNMMIGIHEAVEAVLCHANGIQQERVDAFDIAFEKARPLLCVDEPGDEDAAPYFLQHQVATGVERTIGALMGVSWNEYERANLEVLAK
jgi:hypothetical protein